MKVFLAEHDGKVVFGLSLVVASSKQKAKKLMLAKIEELKAEANKKSFDGEVELTELDVTQPGVRVLFDGIY